MIAGARTKPNKPAWPTHVQITRLVGVPVRRALTRRSGPEDLKVREMPR